MKVAWLVCALLAAAASPVAADDVRDRAWEGVKAWRGRVTITANDTSSENGVTITTNSSLTATFGPLALDSSLSGPGFRVWSGKLEGTMSINTKVDTAAMRSVQKWTGEGAMPPDAEFKIAVDLNKNTLELHVFGGEVAGTIHTEQRLVKGPGIQCCTTEPDTMGVGGFTRTFTLPAAAPSKLERRFHCSFAECPVHGAGGAQAQKEPVSVVVSIEPDTKLKAVPGGPYKVERGQIVVLDGSRSEGGITKYTWNVTPGRCPTSAAPSPKVRDGATWSFIALCPAKATLTVTDGRKTDSKSAPIIVTARTSFITQYSEAKDEKAGDLPAPVASKGQTQYVGGENTCKYEPAAEHSIHPGPTSATWEGTGYTLKQVTDDGPFATMWFVDTESLELARQIWINRWILPGGPARARMEGFYAHNVAARTQIEAYLSAVRTHEHLHSLKLKEAIDRRDPAKKIESMIESSKSPLKQKADREIKQADHDACVNSSDPIRGERKRSFKLEFPRDDEDLWWPTTVDVGGVGAGVTVCD